MKKGAYKYYNGTHRLILNRIVRGGLDVRRETIAIALARDEQAIDSIFHSGSRKEGIQSDINAINEQRRVYVVSSIYTFAETREY